MVSNFWFVMFGTLESFSIVFLGILLFRLGLNMVNIYKAIIFGVILSVLSLVTISYKLVSINPLIQMLAMYILIYIFLERKLLRALFITITPYILFDVIQGGFIYTTNYYKIITLAEAQPFTVKGYVVSICTFVIVMLVGLVVKFTNEGYAYSPDDPFRNNIRLKYSNRLLIFVMLVSSLFTIGAFHFYVAYLAVNYLIVLLTILTLSSFLLLFVNLKREKEEWSLKISEYTKIRR